MFVSARTCCRKYHTCSHSLPRFATRFRMKVDYGKLRHFCDDPVCPDPVWKLSTSALFVSLITVPQRGIRKGWSDHKITQSSFLSHSQVTDFSPIPLFGSPSGGTAIVDGRVVVYYIICWFILC